MTELVEKIEKEKVAELKFPPEEVLTHKDHIHERYELLKRALTLGNLEKSKVRIYFKDDTNSKYVETTVWGLTDKRVILKHGNVIPIHRIYKVSI
ncbi:MAG: hypothetical protein N3F09_04065 [Bacteroidia bacterium]|nr:hypothetical protein [Bacteroidia bacterium]